jgi:putative DNA primase/helicase
MLDEPRLKVAPGPNKAKVKPTWGLVLGKSGTPEACLHNAVALLHHAHEWGAPGRLGFDAFSGRCMVDGRALLEADELELTMWLQRGWSTRFSEGVAIKALRAACFARTYDALTDSVSGLAWDGVPRVDTFAETYLAAEGTLHHRAAGRVLLLSMAARALKPGCKVDTMVILEGSQGTKKSTAAQILGGPFFAELHATVGTQASFEQVEGAWLMEVGELDAMGKAELSAAKKFMSSLSDRYRKAYARTVTDVPRRCVMIGTTNNSVYLRDETGGRRWLPVACRGEVDAAGLRRDRDQLLAEAVHRVRAGEKWWMEDAAELAAAKAEVDERYEVDPWDERISLYLGARTSVTVDELLSALTVPVEARDQRTSNRVTKVLTHAGWTRGWRWNARIQKSERCYNKRA